MSCGQNVCGNLSPEQYRVTQEKGTERVKKVFLNFSSKLVIVYDCRHLLASIITTTRRVHTPASAAELICSGTCCRPSCINGSIIMSNLLTFSSETKYDSGSGWPSFYQTLKDDKQSETVKRIKDEGHGMVRVEVVCKSVSCKTSDTTCRP